MKPKKILCGVDFSEASVHAFETSVDLAHAFNAELHVIHAIEADSPAPDLALEGKATRAMDALVTQAVEKFQDLRVTSDVTTGSAFVEILNAAGQRHSDLIMLGDKGVTMLGERLVGSTSEHVVKEAPCSVLIVRE
jgi:nucleotide-binding universal stress UspA family protein